jgi:hypothetical protein
MAIELVDVGTEPNDATGDPLRTAFQKINNNFVFLQQASSNIADAVTLDDTPNQVIFEYSANAFTQAMFQIKSYNEDNNDSQDIMLQAQLSNDGTEVKFTGYGSSFFGNNVCSYDMTVSSGNVQILVSQITYTGSLGIGSLMVTEGEAGLLTEYGNAHITTEG